VGKEQIGLEVGIENVLCFQLFWHESELPLVFIRPKLVPGKKACAPPLCCTQLCLLQVYQLSIL
jgi:hypothetical protein